MIRHLAALCAAVIALAFTPVAVRAQPGPPPDPAGVTLSADETRTVVLSLAQVLRERFAFRDRAPPPRGRSKPWKAAESSAAPAPPPTCWR